MSFLPLEKINTFFEDTNIYIINLSDSKKRKSSIISQFQGYKNLSFIEAIDGRDTDNLKKNYNIVYNSHLNFSDPLIACICSHAKAIYLAYKNNLDKVVICEDDVHIELIEKCDFSLNEICSINDDWDIIQLYYTEDLILHNDNFKKNGIDLIKRLKNYSGSCYVINRNGMEKFLNQVIHINDDCKNFKILQNILDVEAILFGSLNTFIINRPFCYYYCETMTFDNYTNDPNDQKIYCQQIQRDRKDLLISLYD